MPLAHYFQVVLSNRGSASYPKADDDQKHLEKNPENVVGRECHRRDSQECCRRSNYYRRAYLAESIRYPDVFVPVGVLK